MIRIRAPVNCDVCTRKQEEYRPLPNYVSNVVWKNGTRTCTEEEIGKTAGR